jgi:hypothetical protein
MSHQSLAGHDPRTFFTADDDLAGERAIALGALVGDYFFVVIPLARALSVTSCHGSPSFHNQ